MDQVETDGVSSCIICHFSPRNIQQNLQDAVAIVTNILLTGFKVIQNSNALTKGNITIVLLICEVWTCTSTGVLGSILGALSLSLFSRALEYAIKNIR